MHSHLTRANSLSNEIEQHVQSKDTKALLAIRDGMEETIHSTRTNIQNIIEWKGNQAMLPAFKRNLIVAESNFSLVQSAIDSIGINE